MAGKKGMSKEQTKKKHRKVVKKMLENNMARTEALESEGYSKAYANSVTKTRTWQEVLDEFLPQDKVMDAHRRLLNAKKETQYGVQDDNAAIARGVDMAHKLRGSYAPKKIKNVTELDELSDQELDEQIARIERELGKRK